MTKQPTVSVIVPTYNSSATIAACLQSIAEQSYSNIELIVVDNNSRDDTKAIAEEYTKRVFVRGPERSAQRNFGVSQSKGEWVVIVDSDMVLTSSVIGDCIEKAGRDGKIGGLVVPEESFGEGFWAKCKQLERSFYVGVTWMEAARFFKKDIYVRLRGYNEGLVSGEDWDLSQRIGRVTKVDRVNSFIMHNEGRLKLGKTLQKKYYYAKKFTKYLDANKTTQQVDSQTGIVARYMLFLSQPKRLFKNPMLGLGMLFMKTCEFGFGGIGYINAKMQAKKADA